MNANKAILLSNEYYYKIHAYGVSFFPRINALHMKFTTHCLLLSSSNNY